MRPLAFQERWVGRHRGASAGWTEGIVQRARRCSPRRAACAAMIAEGLKVVCVQRVICYVTLRPEGMMAYQQTFVQREQHRIYVRDH